MIFDITDQSNQYSERTRNVFKPIVVRYDFRENPCNANDTIKMAKFPAQTHIQHLGYYIIRGEGSPATLRAGHSFNPAYWYGNAANFQLIEAEFAGRTSQKGFFNIYFDTEDFVSVTPDQDLSNCHLEIHVYSWDYSANPTETI